MNNRVRLYDLSRELNLDNEDILALCKEHQISYKSHSSTITDAEAETLRQAAQQLRSSPSAPPEPRQPPRLLVRPRRQDIAQNLDPVLGGRVQSSDPVLGGIEALRRALVSDDPQVLSRVVEQLPNYGSEGIDLLIGVVDRETEWEVRFRAWEGLKALSDLQGRALPPPPLRNVGGAAGFKEKYGRGERDFRFANLSGANLRGANLYKADLSDANLSGANLYKTDLSDANLSGANLRGAKLSEADLSRANLSEAYLSEAYLHGAKIDRTTDIDSKWRLVWEIVTQGAAGRNLSEANLSEANLSGADLRGANLREANLSKANLCSANLREANLREANLREANLRGASLSKAYLREAKIDETIHIDPKWQLVWEIVTQGAAGRNLREANLSEANLSGAALEKANLSGANLSEANLSGADLEKASLSQANLSQANLSKANLSGANLSGAYLSKANLSGADLSGAFLSKADLTDSKLRGSNLNGATLDPGWGWFKDLTGTIMPDGSIHP